MRRTPLPHVLPLAVSLLLTACDGEPAPAAPKSPPPTVAPTPPTPPAPIPPPPKDTQTMLKVGDPAPAFRVLDHTGKERTLGDFQGKRVVLWFFPKALTGG